MPRSITIVILALILATSVCIAAETSQPAVQTTQQSTSSKTKPATSKKAETAPVKPPKPAVTRTFETQLSGYTSQDAESLYTRLSLQENRKKQLWFIRGSLSLTETKSGKYHPRVTTSKIDSRLERLQSPKSYSVLTGVLSSRDRDASNPKNARHSGYQFLSYGFGRVLGPRAKGDIGLGMLEVFDDNEGIKPALMLAVRGIQPLTESLSWESDVILLQPVDRIQSTRIDSELGLVHSLSPGLSLRLTWTLNNLIRSVNTNREWDSGVRLSISYRHTTSK